MKKLFYSQFWKNNYLAMLIPFSLLLYALFFSESLFGLFSEDNYVMLHLLIEFFIISASFTIALQAWMTFPHTLSVQKIWLGALFFSIALLEIFHAITYKGMPYFLMESSPYQATWFYIAARLVLAVGLLIVLMVKDKPVSNNQHWIAYGIALLHAGIWIAVIFNPVKLLPDLVIDGVGPTSLKNNLQYVAAAIQVLCMVYLIKHFNTDRTRNLMMLVASCYLLIGDFLFTSYKYVDDIHNFLGHLFQLTAVYFLLRAIYYTSVQEPFQLLQKKKNQIKYSEKFLKTMTSQIGEGIIVMNHKQIITFMNPMAERLLNWRKHELIGKNLRSILNNSDKHCPCQTESEAIIETEFTKKDGSHIPVSYVTTPFIENKKNAGSIIVFRDITEQKKHAEHISYLAYYDEITKLPNYRHFQKQVNEAIANKPTTKKAVMMLDVERFETISESLGHDIGEVVLEAIANRLRIGLPKSILLGSMRGKKFMLFVDSLTSEVAIEILCKQIETIFSEPIQMKHFQLNIITNIGVACYPEHGENETELLKNAQIAMYETQNAPVNFKLFEPMMNEQRLEHLVLENDLHSAIENNELYIEYQPQINLKTGEIHAVEALVRWLHPERGFVSPGKFIPLAEETGLIIPIGEWVLKTACQQVKKWHAQGLPNISVAVNISTRQFFQPNLVQVIEGILTETGVAPKFLELEITESMTMNINNAREVLLELKALGVSIAMDDFGTGYSSLHYLNQFPIDRLKIDRSFIQNIQENKHNAALCTMIITVAEHLNIDVTAKESKRTTNWIFYGCITASIFKDFCLVNRFIQMIFLQTSIQFSNKPQPFGPPKKT
ncbi:bifunctional diguanylate cyclase/phosphodiesterase [Sporosarcina ureilytica]|uniref:Diguanylate cyclase n=1 Tax=Sporosarcina ureilytica TaxID=298596 RepID=A0A1D8JDL9_9BACL|nr:EAL domain-containing protein [Sporosarcina ureilytica]AOV06794.1 hypothetical protein BI350_03800 [Sporosarcina ureilytica]